MINRINLILFSLVIIILSTVSSWAVPPYPTNSYVEVIETELGLYLYWEDVVGETGYKIYRTKNPADGYQQIALLSANSTNYLDSAGLSWDTIYYYALEAFDAGGSQGGVQLEARTPPSPVTFEVEDMPNAQGKLQVYWTVLDTTIKYRIYIENFGYSNEGNITPITNLPGGNNSFVIDELPSGNPVVDGTTYYVAVTPVREYRGIDIENRSILPQEIISIDDEPPSTVTNLIFSNELSGWGQMDIHWDVPSITDLLGYNVYRSSNSFSSINDAELITNLSTNYLHLFIGNSYPYYYAVTVVDIHSNENQNVLSQQGTPAADTYFLEPSTNTVYVNESVQLSIDFHSDDVSSALFQYKLADEQLWYPIVSTAYNFAYHWNMTNLPPEQLYYVRAYSIDKAGNIEGDYNGNKQLDESEGSGLDTRKIYFDNISPEFDVGINRDYTNIRGYVDLMISNYSDDIIGVTYYMSTNDTNYYYFASAVTEDMRFTNLNMSYLVDREIRLRAVAQDRCGNLGTNQSVKFYVDPRQSYISNLIITNSTGNISFRNGDSILVVVQGSGLLAVCDLSELGVDELLTNNIANDSIAEFSAELNDLPDVSTANAIITIYDAAGTAVSETNQLDVELIREIRNLEAYTRLEDNELVIEFNSGAEPESLELYFYDLSGKVIMTRSLSDFDRSNQKYSLQFNPSDLGRGVYIYYINARYINGNVQQASGKIMIMN